MSKKLLMNNCADAENEFEWDYEKTSENPISIKDLCKVFWNGHNIDFNTTSNNQILEIDIQNVISDGTDPQVILLCSNRVGGKIFWENDSSIKVGGYNLRFNINYPIKLKLVLIDNTFSVYANGILKSSTSVYNSAWLPHAGLQLKKTDIIATGFRYKNFE